MRFAVTRCRPSSRPAWPDMPEPSAAQTRPVPLSEAARPWPSRREAITPELGQCGRAGAVDVLEDHAEHPLRIETEQDAEAEVGSVSAKHQTLKRRRAQEAGQMKAAMAVVQRDAGLADPSSTTR